MNKRIEGFETFDDIEDPRERALAQRIEENLSHFAEVEPPANLWAKIAARIESEEPARPVVAEPEPAAPTPLFPPVARRGFSWQWLAIPAFGAAAAAAMMTANTTPQAPVVKAAIPGAATAPAEAVQLLPSIAPAAEAGHWDQVADAFKSYLASHEGKSK